MRYIVLQGTVGSTAYGLNHADSDIDTLGAFIYPAHEYQRLTAPPESIVTHEPDVSLHELGKYMRLALKCNPTITELMWLNEYTETSYYGTRLINIRQEFLSEKYVREAYLGYAGSQLRRLEDRDHKRARKHAKHMARLTNQGKELYTTGNLTIRVPDPEFYEWFQNQEPVYWNAWFAREEEAFRASKCIIPEKPNTRVVEDLYMSIRASEL